MLGAAFASFFLQAYIRNFGEEVVRGQPAFVLSMLLRWLAPALRETAGVSSWQVRAQNPEVFDCKPQHYLKRCRCPAGRCLMPTQNFLLVCCFAVGQQLQCLQVWVTTS